MTDLQTDYSLLSRVSHGEDQARDNFCRTYAPLVQTWVVSLSTLNLNEQDAEDLAQSVVSRMLVKMPNFSRSKGNGKFRPYLKQVVRNEAINYFRRTDVAKIALQERSLSALDEAMGAAETDQFIDHVERRDLQVQLLTQIRSRLTHREWEGWNRTERHEETRSVVAQSLGMTVGAFSRMLSRSREKVQDLRKDFDL